MRSTKTAAILLGCSVLALIALIPQNVHGDEWTLSTRFTVNQPFQVPRLVLHPYTPYVIRLYDSPANRNVVQIYNEDQTQLLTTFMAASDQRSEPPDNTVFTFFETERGYPLPIKEWFYPGRITGLEFIYPKQQAREIAMHAQEPVLSADASDLHDLSAVTVQANRKLRGAPPTEAATTASLTKSETTVVEEKPTPETIVAQQEPTAPEKPAKIGRAHV